MTDPVSNTPPPGGSRADRYTCSYRQLFNTFGAPGIPNTYRAVLSRNGNPIEKRDFRWRRRAENQCMRWVRLYGARMVADDE